MVLDCPLSVKLSWQCFELVSKAFRFDGARFLEFVVLNMYRLLAMVDNLCVNHFCCTELDDCC